MFLLQRHRLWHHKRIDLGGPLPSGAQLMHQSVFFLVVANDQGADSTCVKSVESPRRIS